MNVKINKKIKECKYYGLPEKPSPPYLRSGYYWRLTHQPRIQVQVTTGD